MIRQQRDCNGDTEEGRNKIPLYVVQSVENIQTGHDIRLPSRSDFIADDDSWMDNLFPVEGNTALEGPSDLITEFGVKHNNTSRYPDYDVVKHRGEALHWTDGPDVGRGHHSEERAVVPDRRHPPPTTDENKTDGKLAFQTQYVNLMFSSFSIKGWGHDGTSCFPCHQLHLIEEPTCVYRCILILLPIQFMNSPPLVFHRLLTTTSFPFRIIFANDAFLRLRRNESVLGSSLFDCLVSDDMVMKPQISRAKAFLRSVLRGSGCSIRIVSAEDSASSFMTIPCVVNAYPVVSNGIGSEDIRYYAMRFHDVQT
ncbi:unnamed protein product [Cylindrotheca closterium]|uniref:PAS domain-containing protein n=1 Tax=Cylindrotheca closterium TaxID=2856 RepID=A0AAD2JMF3_9STRA|nr:unnamed protein product [Cylindrotheca closterium]